MTTSHDIVAKLWNLCNLLRDDGVTYHQYVIELTYLLFLKLAKETATESQIPDGYRWNNLEQQAQDGALAFYKALLTHLGNHSSPLVKGIFADAHSSMKRDSTISGLVTEIDKIDWYSAKREGLGDIYEGLLGKDATDKKTGAGQYFTPRPLIDSIVEVMRPNLQDIIQDPAAGTGGFLIAANRYIQANNNLENLTEKQRQKLRRDTFYGMEINQDTQRLALMNLILHDLEFDSQGGGIHYGDTLSSEVAVLPKATLILTNPPFGSKKGGGSPTRNDLEFPTSNKQFCFLQHIYLWLKPGGRAAVILPDNVLFENNVGSQIRADLMDKCNLHTILRLPSGIFYAQGVKTNVLFFTRGKKNQDNTKEVWIYDLRTNMPSFGKRTPLTREHFTDFEAVFGDDPWGNQVNLAKRVETERFRRFDRDWIAERGNNLDITWLKSENDVSEFAEPAVLVREAMGELDAALAELRAILQELGEEINV